MNLRSDQKLRIKKIVYCQESCNNIVYRGWRKSGIRERLGHLQNNWSLNHNWLGLLLFYYCYYWIKWCVICRVPPYYELYTYSERLSRVNPYCIVKICVFRSSKLSEKLAEINLAMQWPLGINFRVVQKKIIFSLCIHVIISIIF